VSNDHAKNGIVLETIHVDVIFPTRTIGIDIEILEEQGTAILNATLAPREPRHVSDLDLLDRATLERTLFGWARTVKPPESSMVLWCYQSGLPDLLALLDPSNVGPPYRLTYGATPGPGP
jgi:hypothetical protein